MEFLDPELEKYAENHTSPEPQALFELNRETHLKVSKPRMLSGHLQGRMLSMISHMLSPNTVLDIGTYTGYSSICFAEGVKEGGIVHTIDNNEELVEMAERYFKKSGFQDRIQFHKGIAKEIIPTLQGPLDLVFIDADKENYSLYFDQVIDKVPSGGFILADNVLWSGKVLRKEDVDKDTKALQEYNEKIHADDRVENVLLPVRDGVMAARKR